MSPEILGKVFLSIIIIDGSAIVFGLSLKASILLYTVKLNTLKLKQSFFTSVALMTSVSAIFLSFLNYQYIDEFSSYLDIGKDVYVYISISSVLALFFPLILSFLQAQEKINKVAIYNLSYGVLSIAFVLYFVVTSEDKLYGYLVGYFFATTFGFIIFFIEFLRLFTLPNISHIIRSIKYSIRYYPTDIFAWLVNFSDRIMLYKMGGAAQNGLYTTAYKFGQACDVLYHSANKALTPIIYSELSKSKKIDTESIRDVYTLLFYIFTTACAIGIYLTPTLIELLAEQYQGIDSLLILILISYLFNGYKLIIDKPLSYYTHLVKYKSLIWGVTAIVNITLNYVLIPIYGVYGAATATLTSFIITLIPMLLISNKAIKLTLPYLTYFNFIVLTTLVLFSAYLNHTLGVIFMLSYIIVSLGIIRKHYNRISN
jgi:O-antigen/teichoic acid export membrane protein